MGTLVCVGILGLFFVVTGIVMIVKKKGFVVLSKSNREVEGRQAVEQGIVALIVGIIILAFAYSGGVR